MRSPRMFGSGMIHELPPGNISMPDPITGCGFTGCLLYQLLMLINLRSL